MQTTLDAFLHRNQHQSSRYRIPVKNDNICNRLQAGATFSRIESKAKVHGFVDPCGSQMTDFPPKVRPGEGTGTLLCWMSLIFNSFSIATIASKPST